MGDPGGASKVGPTNLFFGATFVFLNYDCYINGRDIIRFFKKFERRMLIHSFASFQYGQPNGTLILTVFS